MILTECDMLYFLIYYSVVNESKPRNDAALIFASSQEPVCNIFECVLSICVTGNNI